MKVIVYGGSGYIGKHAVLRLVADGHEVTAFARSETSARAVAALGATAAIGDLDDLAATMDVVRAHDAVVWVAQLMLEDERRVVGAMLDALADTGKTFIFTSGTSLLSIPTNGDWIENNYAEDEPFTPRRQIAPRLDIENMVRDAGQRGVRAMVVRPPLVWGNGGSKIISDFYHSARATGAVCYIGRGLNVYSNVHVDDLAALYSLAIDKGVSGALYHAVTGEVSYGVMADTIARHLGVPARSVTIEEGCDIWDKFMAGIVLCSCSRQRSPRAREELGWAPREDRLDILDDCRHPAYGEETSRPLPSWVKPGS
ncbi:MAG: NAD-dependent epimerase/dehydratase family protein [Porticoccaceae bacterium]